MPRRWSFPLKSKRAKSVGATSAQALNPARLVAIAPPDEAAAVLTDAIRVAGPQEIDAIAIELVGLAAPIVADPADRAPSAVAAAFARLVDRARSGDASPRIDTAPIAGLVDVWDRLALDVRQAASSLGRDRLIRVAGARPTDGDPARARGIARLTQDLNAFELLPWLAAAIARGGREAGAQADAALARMLARFAVQHCALTERDLGPDVHAWGSAGRTLEAAGNAPTPIWATLEPAVRLIGTGARARISAGVLLALLSIAPPDVARDWRGSLAAAVQRSRGASQLLAQTLQRTAIPALRGEAIRWLADQTVRPAARERVLESDGPAEHAHALHTAHLLTRPVRARALLGGAGLKPRLGPKGWPGPAEAAGLSAQQRRAASRWAASLGGRAPETDAALAIALEDPDATVRATVAAGASPTRLREFCFDAEPGIARLAAHRWTGVHGPSRHSKQDRERLASRLARSPIPAARAAAALELSLHDPLRADTPIARLELRRRARADVAGTVTMLRDALIGDDADRAVRAAIATRVLRIERTLASALADAVERDASPRVVSACITALGVCDDERTRRVIESSLAHADARVRANAADVFASVESIPGSARARLVEMKQESAHRPRGAAVRALGAADELASMLLDDRGAHRLAGVWAATHARCASVAEVRDQLARLAAGDPDAAVRVRATSAVRRLRSSEAGATP